MSWKSLTDTYLQEAAGKKVSKLPRQRVIGEDLRSKMPTDEVQYGLPFDDKDLVYFLHQALLGVVVLVLI